MNIIINTCIESLTDRLLEDVLKYENYENASSGKGNFLTGRSMIVCESKGLEEYIKKKCAAEHGIWTALSFKPLAGRLMRCAFELSPSAQRKDEKSNAFNRHNLVWAIYRLLKDDMKYFYFANELASLFLAYQIYRPQMIKNWNNGASYAVAGSDNHFKSNEKFQRELWAEVKNEYNSEQDICSLYELLINTDMKKNEKKLSINRLFVAAPISIAPVQLEALKNLSNGGCKVNLYLYQISCQYTGEAKSDKSIARQRQFAWNNNKIKDENNLYWDLGNRLVANLGRSTQILCEQIGWDNLEYIENDSKNKNDTLLHTIQDKIINDNNDKIKREKDNSVTFNNCFSPLREIEVLCDYILSLFAGEPPYTPEDVAVIAPNMEIYANAVESVFSRYGIPFSIADRDVKKHDKTARLLDMLFSIQGTDYEACDVAALFEYSLYAQGVQLESNDIERLEKWIRENAVRHDIESDNEAPNYSFKSGFDQLLAGFFMIPKNGFSDLDDYCYPDIEDGNLDLLSGFVSFVDALKRFEEGTREPKTIEDWDYFFKENLQYFFGKDKTDFYEEEANPYQKVMGAWDGLRSEMLIGIGNSNFKIDFSILKTALPEKLESTSKSNYRMTGRVSFANIETLRAVPHKVICCIGMNGKDFPRKAKYREISLLNYALPADKDTVNEDKLMFLETIRSAKEKLYISWIGQNEKTQDEIDPSSAVIMLLKNLEEQFGIEEKDIVTKCPLQPFSGKYFEGELETFDNRWNSNITIKDSSVWNWRIKGKEEDKRDDIDELYRALNDAPKHFIKNICNISLPEDNELLENIEPFIIDEALDKWKLRNMVVNEKDNEKLNNQIKILKRKGELPDGVFGQKYIDNIINEANKLKEEADKIKDRKCWIFPGSDKGKYRLKHWLKHLEYNINEQENKNTIMFLNGKEGPVRLELKGLKKADAEKLLNNLWDLKKELGTKLIPVFPDAAWEYLSENSIEKAEVKLFGKGEHDYSVAENSAYGRMVFGDMEILEGKLKKEFIKYSKLLFNEAEFTGEKNETA